MSENFTNDNKEEEEGGSVRDITSQAIRQTIEENQDLKRQNILLEQKLEEKERKIKALERVLVSEEKSYGLTSHLKKTSYVNSASQVEIFPIIIKYTRYSQSKVIPESYAKMLIMVQMQLIIFLKLIICNYIFSD